MYCRAAALASGHTPEDIRGMTVGDLERIGLFKWAHNLGWL